VYRISERSKTTPSGGSKHHADKFNATVMRRNNAAAGWVSPPSWRRVFAASAGCLRTCLRSRPQPC
jgi:hypothetical protein